MKKVLFLRVYHCAPYMSQLGGSSGPEAGRSRKKARKNKKRGIDRIDTPKLNTPRTRRLSIA